MPTRIRWPDEPPEDQQPLLTAFRASLTFPGTAAAPQLAPDIIFTTGEPGHTLGIPAPHIDPDSAPAHHP
ncbi:MAG TPA: hypothetical protein VKV33_10520, partial [Streptosporangiaceae bacterium]|nr:hypothetical protein [Streptosporangiaceae bacterium]